MNARRPLVVLAITAAVSSGWLPRAAADATLNDPFGAEAWYQPNPSCASPTGCPPVFVPPESPYPAGTLHVGVADGGEIARSYLTLRGPRLPDNATILAATLTIPVDSDAADGSLAPDSAKIKVCTSPATVPQVEGSFDQPPPVTCNPGSIARYSATPSPHFIADLTPLAANLAESGVVLAVLPADNPAQTDTWRVVFSSHMRASPPTPPASVTLTVGTLAAAAPPPPADTGIPFIPPPPAMSFVAPAVAPPQPVLPQPSLPDGTFATAPVVHIRAYPHPGLVLLPLLFLVLLVTLGRELTGDLTPARLRRDGWAI